MKNNKGIIKIQKLVFDDDLQKGGGILKEIFSVFFPIKIEYHPFDECFIYYGYSSLFREVWLADESITYDVIATISDNGVYTISFKQIV